MPSKEHQAVVELSRARLAGDPPATVEAMRARFDGLGGLYPLPDDVKVSVAATGGRDCEVVSVPESEPGRAVLYLHGGGYVVGSPPVYRELASRIARRSASTVFVLDYRLA